MHGGCAYQLIQWLYKIRNGIEVLACSLSLLVTIMAQELRAHLFILQTAAMSARNIDSAPKHHCYAALATSGFFSQHRPGCVLCLVQHMLR